MKTAKKKLYLLAGAFFVAMILVYTIAISGTVDLKRQCNSIDNELEKLQGAPEEIKEIENKLLEYNALINQDEEGAGHHAYLLNFFTPMCKEYKLVMKEFPKPHFFNSSEYTVETNRITFEGEYIALMNLIYKLETTDMKGHISSLNFSTVPDHRNGNYKLKLSIYEQNIYNNNEK